jgi:glutathione S-transferase
MILIGQYDSPFVRRVAVAMTLYELTFEHRPWSVFGDAEKIQPYNPLIRVPTLVLDDGDVLIDSHVIIDYVDSLVPAEKALYPREEPARHRALKVAALAAGIADKAVALFYELRLHKEVSQPWIDRCRSQIGAALGVLEADRAKRTGACWFGERMSHADIAVTAMLRHLNESHPGLVRMADFPALQAHGARNEALPVFRRISQPFLAPA